MSISNVERVVGYDESTVDITDIGRTALGSIVIPEQRRHSDYPDYNSLSNLDKIQKINWVSDWVNWLRRDKDAYFDQEYAKDVLTYFNQALVSMVEEPDAQTSSNVRRLNNLVLGMYDQVYGLGEGVTEQVLSEINDENLRVLATEVISDDVKFWGDSLVIFETLLKDDGKLAGYKVNGYPWRLKRLLLEGEENSLPQSLQRFIHEVSAVEIGDDIASERTSRLLDVREKLLDMNIGMGIDETNGSGHQASPSYKTYFGPDRQGSPSSNRLYSQNYVGNPVITE
jgi:hypothetical protein